MYMYLEQILVTYFVKLFTGPCLHNKQMTERCRLPARADLYLMDFSLLGMSGKWEGMREKLKKINIPLYNASC